MWLYHPCPDGDDYPSERNSAAKRRTIFKNVIPFLTNITHLCFGVCLASDSSSVDAFTSSVASLRELRNLHHLAIFTQSYGGVMPFITALIASCPRATHIYASLLRGYIGDDYDDAVRDVSFSFWSAIQSLKHLKCLLLDRIASPDSLTNTRIKESIFQFPPITELALCEELPDIVGLSSFLSTISYSSQACCMVHSALFEPQHRFKPFTLLSPSLQSLEVSCPMRSLL